MQAVIKKKTSAKQLAHVAKMNEARAIKVARGEITVGRPLSLKTLQSRADKDAREKFLAYASTNVLPVGEALVEKAKSGDVQAMKEFFDRTWGRAPQSLEVKGDIQFSLVSLLAQRDILPDDVVPIDVEEIPPLDLPAP